MSSNAERYFLPAEAASDATRHDDGCERFARLVAGKLQMLSVRMDEDGRRLPLSHAEALEDARGLYWIACLCSTGSVTNEDMALSSGCMRMLRQRLERNQEPTGDDDA